jgi:hypothetical protein
VSDVVNIGRKFEEDFAQEMDLSRVQGSGNQWHSKLDVRGRGTLWSLKATRSAQISGEDFREAIMATLGPGGDGRLALMAVRFFAESEEELDLVMMRKDEFFRLVAGDLELTVPNSKSQERMARAAIPELLREVDEDE